MADNVNPPPPPSPPPQSAAPEPKKRRWGRIILFSVLGVVVLLLVLVALLPAILSSGWGRGVIANIVNDNIPGRMQIDDLALSWGGGQRIQGFTLLDPDGRRVATIDTLTTDLSLWSAIRGVFSLGETRIEGLDADIVAGADGQTNLDRALGLTKEEKPEEPTTVPASLSIHGYVTDAKIQVTQAGQPPVLFDNVNAELQMPSPAEPIALKLTGRTKQGDIAGDIDISGTAENVFDVAGTMTADRAMADLTAKVNQLPVAGIDGLAAMDGLLVAALGEVLNLEATANATTTQQTIHVQLRSPNLTANLRGVADEKQFTAEPSQVDFTLTPALVAKLGERTARSDIPGADPQNAMQLAAPVPLKLTLTRLSGPLTDTMKGPIAIHAELAAGGDIRLSDVQQVGDVTIPNLAGMIDAAQLSRQLKFALNAGVITSGEPGRLAINGTAANLTTDQAIAIDATAELTGVPTALVGRIAGRDDLVTLLGPQMNLQATANTTTAEQAAGRIAVQLASPKLTTRDLALVIEQGMLRLAQPAQAEYQLTPDAAAALLGPNPAATVDQPVTLTLAIRGLSAPWPKGDEPFFQPERTNLDATLSATPLHLSGVTQLDRLVLEGLTGTLKTKEDEGLGNIQLAVNSTLTDPRNEGLLRAASGGPLKFQMNAATGLLQAGPTGAAEQTTQLKPIAAIVQLDSQGLVAKLAARLDGDFETLQLTEPGSARVILTPALLQQLDLVSPGQPTLAAPSTVTLNIPQLSAPIADFSAAKVKTQLAATVDQLRLASDDPRLGGAAVQNAKLDVNLDGPAGIATVKFDAQAAVPGQAQPGPINIDARLADLFRPEVNPAIQATAKIEGLPTAFVDMIADQGGKLAPLIGPLVSINAVANIPSGKTTSGTIEAKLAAANLNADAALAVRDNIVTNTRPITLNLALTPEGYAAWTQPAPPEPGQPPAEPPAIVLAERSQLQITVPRLSAVLPAPSPPGANAPPDAPVPSFDMSKVSVEATVTSPALSLRDRNTGQSFVLQDVKTAVNAPTLAQPMTATLTAVVLASAAPAAAQAPGARPAQPPPGTIGRALNEPAAPPPPTARGAGPSGGGMIDVKARIADLYTPAGLNTDAMTIHVTAGVAEFPTAVLDQMLDQGGLIVAALGPVVNVNAAADLKQMKGPVMAKLNAANGAAEFDGHYGEVITLNKPLIADLQVTPQLGSQFLGKLHFLFESLESGENAVQLRIEPEGVSFPTKDFNIAQVRIPRITVAPGKLVLNNSGHLGKLINFAKQLSEQRFASRNPEMTSVWFTPLEGKLENGRFVYTKRMDMLLDGSMHLATWGSVDVVRQQRNLVIAFMPETLDKLFDIENVGPDEALRIPMTERGIDFGTAAIDIAKLKGVSQLKGDIGSIVGAVVGGAQRNLFKGEPIPPASMQPLPWGPLPDTAAPPPPGAPGAAPPPPGTEAQQPTPKERRPSDREALEKAAGSLLEGLLKDREKKKN